MREDKEVGVGNGHVPADELRCERNDGKTWRCKRWRLQDNFLCQNHYFKIPLRGSNNTGRRVKPETTENVRVEESNGLGKRRKRSFEYKRADFLDEETQRQNCEGVFDVKQSEECDIPELIELLQTVYQDKEFQLVEHIFKLREEKMKVKKDEAEKLLVYLEKEMGVYETKCAELTDELEQRKQETSALERKVRELGSEKKSFEIRRREYDRKCHKLQEDLEIACQGQRVSDERILHLKRTKTVAENETEVWKKRCKELEILVLREPQLSRGVYVAPKGLPAEVSDTRERKKCETGPTELQSESKSALQMHVKEEAVNYCDRMVYASANVDVVSNPSAKENRIAQLAGKHYISRKTTIQNKTGCAVDGARLSDMKIKEESLDGGLAQLAGIKKCPPGFD